jgi:hypothetical protein
MSKTTVLAVDTARLGLSAEGVIREADLTAATESASIGAQAAGT